MTEEMSIIGSEAYNAAKEILDAARLEEGGLFVVGRGYVWLFVRQGVSPSPRREGPLPR